MVHALRGAPDDGAHERVNDWQTYSRRLSARTARLAGPLLRIRRSGSVGRSRLLNAPHARRKLLRCHEPFFDDQPLKRGEPTLVVAPRRIIQRMRAFPL